MSFLFPRTISIRRPNGAAATAVGDIGYSGQTEANETVIVKSVAASIQQKGERVTNPGGSQLPADAVMRIGWVILTRKADVALGFIQNGDVCVDELGNRYTVLAPYWGPLGYRLACEFEKA